MGQFTVAFIGVFKKPEFFTKVITSYLTALKKECPNCVDVDWSILYVDEQFLDIYYDTYTKINGHKPTITQRELKKFKNMELIYWFLQKNPKLLNELP